MKNEKLAKRAYEDYKVKLQKEGDLERKLQILLYAVDKAKDEAEEPSILDEMDMVQRELNLVKKDANKIARLIVYYVFGQEGDAN